MKRTYRITRVNDVVFTMPTLVDDTQENDALVQLLAEQMLEFADMDDYPTPLVYQEGVWMPHDQVDWALPIEHTFDDDWASSQLAYEVETFDQEDGQT